ncbi:hypothetical protein [Sphingomonas koreensis]
MNPQWALPQVRAAQASQDAIEGPRAFVERRPRHGPELERHAAALKTGPAATSPLVARGAAR